MGESPLIVRRVGDLAATPTRRAGIRERRLLTPDDAIAQNVVHIETDAGATVEDHAVSTSESIYVLAGRFEVTSNGRVEVLERGSLCFFQAGSRHGLRCIEGPGEFLIVFAPSAGARVPENWLQLLYSESWRQYVHEDNLTAARNAVFLGVNAALLALIASMVKPLSEPWALSVGGAVVDMAALRVGFVLLIPAAVAIRLAESWAEVTKSGRAYLNIRHVTARAIEVAVRAANIGPASVEHRWRGFLKQNPGKDYAPFSSIDHVVPPMGKYGGWAYLLVITSVMRSFWWVVAVVGLVCVATWSARAATGH